MNILRPEVMLLRRKLAARSVHRRQPQNVVCLIGAGVDCAKKTRLRACLLQPFGAQKRADRKHHAVQTRHAPACIKRKRQRYHTHIQQLRHQVLRQHQRQKPALHIHIGARVFVDGIFQPAIVFSGQRVGLYRKTCLRFFKLMCATSLGKICASDHAMNAVDEMSALNRDLKRFFDEAGAQYPVWKALEAESARNLK